MTPLPRKFVSWPYRFAAIWLLVVGAPLALVVGAIVGSLSANLIGKTVGTILAVGCGTVVALYAVLVFSRVGVIARSDGVLVRGYARNRHIDWHDIDRFEDQDTQPWQANAVLVSGERIKLSGLGPSWLFFHDHTLRAARQSVADLNTIRSEVLSGEGRSNA